ncbi:MAG TPA: AgmX/PglI C-terminal domain-containing protein [Polyangiaceae bacterium]|nr:AgmX/PglI C-terminal domain-containing protein [Polyangiaceae bacterium]
MLGPGAGTAAPAQSPASASSSSAVDHAKNVVAGLRAPFQQCYEQELLTSKDASGKLKLRLDLDASGAVASTSVEISGNLLTTGECVRAVARTAKFLPPDVGSAVIEVPIVFVKKSEFPAEQELPCVPAH